MYTDLRAFVEALERAGELLRVTEPVDPVLEIVQRADRESKSRCHGLGSAGSQRTDPEFCAFGGKALLFENPIGSDIPVLINAFGSYKRIEMAIGGRGLEEIAEQIAGLVKPEPPRSLSEALGKGKQFAPLLKIGPKRSKKRGVCQQVVRTGEGIDLTRLPILRCWELDGDFASMGYPADVNGDIAGLGHPEINDAEWNDRYRGRFITLAGVHTIHAGDRDDPKPKSHNIGMYR
ncbi:MAG: UbiD family decarboxylase, partial [Phycisphaerales bacterium]|nr:UbiD family decarboxylase [Phycisphaerales bacterium]